MSIDHGIVYNQCHQQQTTPLQRIPPDNNVVTDVLVKKALTKPS